jgi:hypothetical protein
MHDESDTVVAACVPLGVKQAQWICSREPGSTKTNKPGKSRS